MVNNQKSARRIAIEQRVLEVTRDQFLGLAPIAYAMRMPKHTLRSRYLYPMAREGLLEKKYPHRTRFQQYRAAKN